MPEEPLFEVWVNGRPWLDARQAPFRFPADLAAEKAKAWRQTGHEAVVVPDQSKRPPDHELLQDR